MQFFGKTGQLRERLLQMWSDVIPRAALAHDKTLLDQLIDRRARGDALHAERLGQQSLRGQRLVRLETPGTNGGT